MAATSQAPRTIIKEVRVPSVGTAGNDSDVACGRSLVRPNGTGTVTGVIYYPDAALSGADTNSRTLTLYNRGAGGGGTTKIAELALTAGVNLVKDQNKTITLQAAGNLALAVTDLLSWVSLHVGSGLTDPGGLLEITITRD